MKFSDGLRKSLGTVPTNRRPVSGSKDAKGRPGYKQMLADAEAKLFDVLLVDDFSRLSRDKRESEQPRRRMVFHGIGLPSSS